MELNSVTNIRVMEHSDLPRVLELENLHYPFPWTEGIFQDCLKVNYNCWVYEHCCEIIGYIVQSFAVGEAHILNVCVAEEHRMRGIGNTLVKEAINDVAQKNVDTIFLEVRESNSAAISIYNKVGFVEVGMRKSYYPAAKGREDAIVMARELI